MRNPTGAHYGLRDWLFQRITAVVMAVYTVVIAVAVFCGAASSFESWRGFFACGPIKFLSFLFAVCLCYHAWIGIRDIWMDYVKPVAVRLTLHALTLLALMGYAAWCADILWRL
ncbi:MAG TPA: succinate dehydrogenase, hydrophobic membrane anchor protein [Rhodocyclaceae bacterium]|jgi:succinate dehydrogenase / fumarate reductase membrane anchor subunit|nr:succinate dehydrogenase, hydrophobic membrane anchor protein [Rhodocyclaceae bacterium]